MSSPARYVDKHGDTWVRETWERDGDAMRRVEEPAIAFPLAEAESRYGPFTPPVAATVCPTCGQVITNG